MLMVATLVLYRGLLHNRVTDQVLFAKKMYQ